MLGRVREDVVARTNGAQVPWVEEAVLGEFFFSEPEPAGANQLAGALANDDLIFWRSIWRSKETGDYEAYLKQFPEGTFASLAANRLAALTSPAIETPAKKPAGVTADTLSEEELRLAKNSLYWLGYYNGPLTGTMDEAVAESIQAFQAALYEDKSGMLTEFQLRQLHDAAADSLISLGERLAERTVFDRARLASIDRGIFEIAVPAYQQLVERLASRSDGEEILMDAKRQLDSMRGQRDTLARSFERVYRQYLTVVAAAGVGYPEQIKAARSSIVRAGGTESDIGQYISSRRQLFLQHALDYAKKGGINERFWLAELR